MFRSVVSAAALCFALCAGASTDPRVEHVVLLVLENRGFDHMLGAFAYVRLGAACGAL